MIVGFVLINIAPQHETEVCHKLMKLPEIVKLHPLFGEYDLIARFRHKIMRNSDLLLSIKYGLSRVY